MVTIAPSVPESWKEEYFLYFDVMVKLSSDFWIQNDRFLPTLKKFHQDVSQILYSQKEDVGIN